MRDRRGRRAARAQLRARHRHDGHSASRTRRLKRHPGNSARAPGVVAEEVRNLAQRSAQAARETAGKIEDSIQKSQLGVEISTKVAASLGEIVQKAREMDELVSGIATASTEQNKGVGQINTAVRQMDHTTQQNAAAAEECASVAEELNGQAIALKKSVQELLELVGGHGSTTTRTPAQRDESDEMNDGGEAEAAANRHPSTPRSTNAAGSPRNRNVAFTGKHCR